MTGERTHPRQPAIRVDATPMRAFTTGENTANLIGSMRKVFDNFGGEGAR
jgi:hypothetical protein